MVRICEGVEREVSGCTSTHQLSAALARAVLVRVFRVVHWISPLGPSRWRNVVFPTECHRETVETSNSTRKSSRTPGRWYGHFLVLLGYQGQRSTANAA